MEKKSEEEHDASQSTLFYLFREVSKIASTAHNSFLDTDPPSKWLDEVSRKDPLVVEKKEKEAHLITTYNSSCQHNVSRKFPRRLVKLLSEESQSHKVHPSKGRQCETNSPWKVLSLINLHCEKLLHRKEECDPSSASSTTQLDSTTRLSLTEPDVADLGARNDSSRIEYTLGTSLLLPETQQICTTDECRGYGDELQCCMEESEEDCETDEVGAELKNDASTLLQQQQQHSSNEINFRVDSELEGNQESRKSHSSTVQVPSDVSSSEQQTNDACSHIQETLSSNDEVHADPCKPLLMLDHNASILSSEPQSDTQKSSSQPVTPKFTPADSCQSLSSQKDKITTPTVECTLVPPEEQSAPSAQQEKFVSLSSATSRPDIWTKQLEELGSPSNCERKAKKPRKQLRPCRSADSADPGFQGVAFRMDAELDDTRDQCRLLITSKYSKLNKSAKKQRLRTKNSQKSFRTSSSEEENNPTSINSKHKACASCCTTKTPMWRDAEDGTPLCNACGIRFKKYKVRCVSCWHIPRKEEGTSNSSCLKCGKLVRPTSAQRKHTT